MGDFLGVLYCAVIGCFLNWFAKCNGFIGSIEFEHKWLGGRFAVWFWIGFVMRSMKCITYFLIIWVWRVWSEDLCYICSCYELVCVVRVIKVEVLMIVEWWDVSNAMFDQR